MKNLTIIIALLMTLCGFSQGINTRTPEQQQRINEVFTDERIIDLSKCVSNEKAQDSVIRVRDTQLIELQDRIEILKREHKNTLIEIAKQNNIAKDTSKDIDDSTSFRDKNKFNWFNFHLYTTLQAPRFNFKNTELNSELLYEINKIEIGIVGAIEKDKIELNDKYSLNYYLKLRYKFF